MGSPNFYSGTNGLNIAVDFDLFSKMNSAIVREDYPDLDDDEVDEVLSKDIYQLHKDFQEFIDNELPQTYFHKIVVRNGYNNGFQAYIDPEYVDLHKYIEGAVSDWQRYQEFTGMDGYVLDLESCPYFRKNIKNITAFNLNQAINAEYKALHNLILEQAKIFGMGEVVGRIWDSSIQHPINTKPI